MASPHWHFFCFQLFSPAVPLTSFSQTPRFPEVTPWPAGRMTHCWRLSRIPSTNSRPEQAGLPNVALEPRCSHTVDGDGWILSLKQLSLPKLMKTMIPALLPMGFKCRGTFSSLKVFL
ncbi:hypothetical protein H1C71_033634 [Ictidomys tridecemlineatus]|nr:hypothetical protein H1C71_033634 [Ictidomys tridecemlineatus]